MGEGLGAARGGRQLDLLFLGLRGHDGGATHTFSQTLFTWLPAGGFSVDVGFLQDMSLHHDQAVKMAYIVLDKPIATVDATIRGIAPGVEIVTPAPRTRSIT